MAATSRGAEFRVRETLMFGDLHASSVLYALLTSRLYWSLGSKLIPVLFECCPCISPYPITDLVASVAGELEMYLSMSASENH